MVDERWRDGSLMEGWIVDGEMEGWADRWKGGLVDATCGALGAQNTALMLRPI